MIRYPISSEALRAQIAQQFPGWLEKAAEMTRELPAHADNLTSKSFNKDMWGKIKTIYIQHQHEKCAYCESKLQGEAHASKVHEVEHFRPKTEVKPWPPKKPRFPLPEITWNTGSGSKQGYYLLAYEYRNYAIACTRCNSTLKESYFPIAGVRKVTSHFADLIEERPLLIFPFGMEDTDDPEDLISWYGPNAKPRYQEVDDLQKFRRTMTTIGFFGLNELDLEARRREMLQNLYPLFKLETSSDAELSVFSRKRIEQFCSAKAEFSACARAFRKLYRDHQAEAEEIIKAMK